MIYILYCIVCGLLAFGILSHDYSRGIDLTLSKILLYIFISYVPCYNLLTIAIYLDSINLWYKIENYLSKININPIIIKGKRE